VAARDISSFGGWRSYIAWLDSANNTQSEPSTLNGPAAHIGRVVEVPADPASTTLDLDRTALLLIDMQRDFIEPGGFGESRGNDVSRLQSVVEPCQALLAAARQAGLLVFHTREGHHRNLDDLPAEKLRRGVPGKRIGDVGPMGRILIRGEPGQDFIPQLSPASGELVIDKPGKGAFYNTNLDSLMRLHQIRTLIVCGVTTEVCVHTTVREANDRGYRVVVAGDCCGSYFPEFHRIGLEMITAQDGIFGYVCQSSSLIEVLTAEQLLADS